MIIGNKTTKEIYVELYKSLQAEWKKESNELMLVGRLAYWTFWISKLAESSQDKEEKNQLFELKAKGLILLSKSEYVELRKYVPPFHKKMCEKHSKVQSRTSAVHKYIQDNADLLNACPDCQKGEDYFFSLYSVAVLDKARKPLFIMHAPYSWLKDVLPDIDALQSVKFYNGRECRIHEVGKPLATKVNKKAFTKEMVLKYFKKNYKAVLDYYKKQKRPLTV